jgi:hypothetical protein
MPNTLSGQVVDRLTGTGLAGVTVSYTGAASGSSLTAANGSYVIMGLADGTYTLTPAKGGYVFAPTKTLTLTLRSALPATATVAKQDFVGSAEITGRVTNFQGNGVPGVTVTADPSHLAVTDADGYYAIGNLAGGTYTLTPARGIHAFVPATRPITPPVATSQDFVELALARTFLPLVVR